MQLPLRKFFSALSISLLVAAAQSNAQSPQIDTRPRTASISGRVTIAGKPAANAVITVMETDSKQNPFGGLVALIPFQAKTRTDGDGRYLVSGLAEGSYVVTAVLKAFVAADSSGDPTLSRTVTLDAGEAREKLDFALMRGGVMTGKVTDDVGAPLIARRLRIYRVDEQSRRRDYYNSSLYEMLQTDDRGVYRIYGLPPGRYIINAGGEGGGDLLRIGGGKFALTWHPDTTDEKQARVIEIKEGSEVAEVDIRFASARKTYEAAGRVVDRETGKPVPRLSVSCISKPEKDSPVSGFSTDAIADGQGNFRLPGLPPGRYKVVVRDVLEERGYTGEVTEFEITNDNVSDVEVKTFPGASVSGVVVIEGVDAAAGNQFKSITIEPRFTPSSNATGATDERYSIPQYLPSVRINADGSFTIRGLQAGRVSFRLLDYSGPQRIKRVERDGVEIKDAIEVKPGEKIDGVRIAVYQAQGRIRGQVQIVGGSLPDASRLYASAAQLMSAEELISGARIPVAIGGIGRSAFVDEKGRFVIEGLSAGEYDLTITLTRRTGEGSWESASSPRSNQRVILGENEETSVTITFDLSGINQPKKQEDRR
jgi:hypothetical protein